MGSPPPRRTPSGEGAITAWPSRATDHSGAPSASSSKVTLLRPSGDCSCSGADAWAWAAGRPSRRTSTVRSMAGIRRLPSWGWGAYPVPRRASGMARWGSGIPARPARRHGPPGRTASAAVRRGGLARSVRRPRGGARLAAEVAFGLGRQPGEYRPGGDVLLQRLRVDLVEGVVGGVMQVEVVAAVLGQPGPGHAPGRQRDDVRAGTALAGRVLDAQRRQRLCDLAGGGLRVLRRAGVEGVDAAGAEVALG